MLIQLSRYLFDDSKTQIAFERIMKNKDAKEKQKAQNEFKSKLMEVYPKVRKGVLDAIRRKMVQVMEEPLLHNKSGAIQPYDWINENRS